MIKKFEIIKYENQDLEEMPFSAKANPNVVGYKKEKKLLMNFVRNGDICLLTGEPGTGKSSLLLWLAKNSKLHNVFYIDASSIEKDFNIKKFLKNSRKGFDKFRAYPKDSIMLLDESQDCSSELQKTLGSLWDHNFIKSIVMAQINPNLENFSQSFKDRIGNRIVKLSKLSNSDLIKLMELRCKDKLSFNLKDIEEIIKEASNMPRRILEICESLYIKNNKECGLKKDNFKIHKNSRWWELKEIKGIVLEKKRMALENDTNLPDTKTIFEKRKQFYEKKNPSEEEGSDKKTNEKIEIVEKGFPNNSYEYKYRIGDISQKRLTLLQKNIISEIWDNHKTIDEIAESLSTPPQIIKNEIKILFKNGIIVAINNAFPSAEVSDSLIKDIAAMPELR